MTTTRIPARWLPALLAGPERVVAVPESSRQPHRSPFVQQASQVEPSFPKGAGPDPEQLLAPDPDLVVLTLAHDHEEDAAARYLADIDAEIDAIRTACAFCRPAGSRWSWPTNPDRWAASSADHSHTPTPRPAPRNASRRAT